MDPLDAPDKKYKFLIEKPSKDDLFDGGSHSKTADAVFETLSEDNDVNVIGIEGELGSGKSTVLELIKAKASAESYDFIDFDVERYQHGATKKALIETLCKSITPLSETEESKSKIKRAKDIALGNQFEYTAKVNSNVNIWIIWFSIALLAGIRLLPNTLEGLGDTVMFAWAICSDGFIEATKRFSFDGVALTGLLFAFIPWHIVHCGQKGSRIFGFLGTPPSTGDIFKRNSTDKITESIEINKEVGAYELQAALEVFVAELPTEKRLILILDNLDRVTNEKLREVWSDIEVFTSIAQAKIQLVIPYSTSHVASSISPESNKKEGLEYISKRIPISFRVAPILSADWKSSCTKMIQEANICNDDDEIKVILTVIDTWAHAFDTQVTPRFLKKTINATISTLITNNEDISPPVAFLYQLSVQACGCSLDEVLSSQIENSEAQQALEKCRLKMDGLYTRENWSKQFVSIHYLSNYEIAESELITTPLTRALENKSFSALIAKQNIYAYDKILLEILEDNGTDQLIQAISTIEQNPSEDELKWVDVWLPKINAVVKKDVSDCENMGFTLGAYITLQKNGIGICLDRINRFYEKRNKPSEELLGKESIDEDLNILYRLSEIIEEHPKAITEFNPNMFISHLWPIRERSPYWSVSVSDFSADECVSIFAFAEEEGELDDSLLLEISDHIRLGYFHKKQPSLYAACLTYSQINANEAPIIANLYCPQWYASDQHNYYGTNFPHIKDVNAKNKFIAQAVANSVYYSTSRNYKNLLSPDALTDDFHQELANCLAISCSFDKILNKLEDSVLGEYLTKAVKLLISNRRINRLGIDDCIDNVTKLKKIGLPTSELLSFLWPWGRKRKVSLSWLEGINNTFVSDILTENNALWSGRLTKILDSSDADTAWWKTQIIAPNENIQLIFSEWFNKNNKNYNACSGLSEALKEVFTTEPAGDIKNLNEAQWISSILKALPKGSVDSIYRALDKQFEMSSTSYDLLNMIIVNLGEHAKIPTPKNFSSQKHALTLFENLITDADKAKWFDEQNYGFDKWDDSLLEGFIIKLTQYEEDEYSFETINSNSIISKAKEDRAEKNEYSENSDIE